MSHPGEDTPDWYVKAVRKEIHSLQRYFVKQMWWYRSARIVVIVAAASVPVLAAVPVVPRWVLGILGAIAATAGAIQDLFQFRKSALNAMKTANALERVLNKYMTSVPPYNGSTDRAFPKLVAAIEAIREHADEAFLETWQQVESTSRVATTEAEGSTPGQRPPLDGQPSGAIEGRLDGS